MKVMRAKTLLFFLILVPAALVHADVIVDNLHQPTENYSGPIGDGSTTNSFLIGQEFTLPPGATPYHLNKITLLLSATGGGANITVSVWNVGPDNNPTNEIAVVSSRLVANAGNVDFVPSTNLALAPGIYYVVAAPATPADSDLVSWAFTTSTNWTGSGVLGGFADTSPGAWENFSITNYPQQMSVQAVPVPAAIGISRPGGATVLSWPSTLNGYVVESTANLAPPTWRTITNAPALVAGNNFLTNSAGGSSRFFRLRQSFVVDNLEQPTRDYFGPIGSDSTTNDFLIGQEFTLPARSYTLDKVTLLLNPINGNGRVTVSIWNAGPDNNPNNEIAVVSSRLVTNVGNVDFIPSTPITLPPGNYYVVAAPTTSADNALVGWAYAVSTTWTGFGTLGGFADTYSGSWQNFSIETSPQQMSVQATPAPPPGGFFNSRPKSGWRPSERFSTLPIPAKNDFYFGKGSHMPHDFSFSFISHFIPGKQHNRRFPDASMSQAFSIRRLRVSGCLAVLIEKIQSRRAMGVISAHAARADGAAARAWRRSIGTLASGSSPARVISTVTVSPAFAPAASCMTALTLSQWLPWPSGSRAARKGKALMAPSTIVRPREGSFALAFLGRVRTVNDPIFSVASGRINVAVKRIVGLASCGLAGFIVYLSNQKESAIESV